MKKFFTLIAALIATINIQAQGWPAQYGGVMLQGFSWDSYDYSQWTILESQAADMKGFIDFVWVPQSGKCLETTQVMGYMPYYYFQHDSSFGTEAELRSMIKTFKENGIRTMADVVVNHHQTDGWFGFPAETYNGVTYQFKSTDICRNDDGGATLKQANTQSVSLSPNNDEGEDFSGGRDLDHKSENVQRIIKAYVKYLKDDLGYEGFRYDMVKGFDGSHVADYNDAAGIEYSVGEHWSGVSEISSWIKATNYKSAAFDFQFHYAMTDAIKQNNWQQLNNHKTLMHDADFRRYAVTFVENHDIQDRGVPDGQYNTKDPITEPYILAANAYLLAMPGTPCIFQPHWRAYEQELKSMIEARKLAGITNTSDFGSYLSNTAYCQTFAKGEGNMRLMVAVGDETKFSVPNNYTRILSGSHYAYFLTKNAETAWANKPSGTYGEAFDVTLTAVSEDANAKLVYTLDGTNPTAGSKQVNSGATVRIDNACTLKVALLTGGKVTGLTTKEYAIKAFEPYSFKVYVSTDKVSWKNINFYSWGTNSKNNSAAWPGDKISATETVNGRTWYCKEYYIDSKDDLVNFVFSTGTGSPQTVDKTGVCKTAYFEISTTMSNGKHTISDVTKDMTTGIYAPAVDTSGSDNGWYDINGRRYNKRPAGRGLYIHQGKKYVIK